MNSHETPETIWNSLYHIPESTEKKIHQVKDLYNRFISPMSTLFPSLIFLIFSEGKVSGNLFLRFLVFILPLSYLSIHHFSLFFTTKKLEDKSPNVFHSFLKILFLSLSIIFTLSIILFPIRSLSNNNLKKAATLFLPRAVLSTYLLSISCSLELMSFIDTEQDALLDLAIFICIITSGVIFSKFEKIHLFLFVVSSFILIPLRSLKEKHKPSPKSTEVTLWRQALFALILLIIITTYIFSAYLCMFNPCAQESIPS
ncbi:uncharacterized protein Eint_110020 [Encephalitozoon intestinalis ATCC 50506]|uniref:Uncharacterized protein n=1 Tax=Encephalitozoon intestinalis (strain ATCC 50506) TaxID=876142 RepID=E0SA77_ENCIT|nr:uncharacterized protein Eint_110020 [Encephalitozoon intestinalis ATCC 50506]ADM12504.1 hypothetical protein Eint_110020 [Encephalitozoon intestinalis ATCC 50506]UTX46355.1 DUF2463 domain-containing protein [Encephalitozoon intestinalis]